MKNYVEKMISCPTCGHHTPLIMDASNGDQDFYEDCRVCCNPIHCRLQVDESNDKLLAFVDADDEQYF
ncbi:CPXCG motif-containing cysteine-rich protein [Agarivorans sp. OAG1]|uniref:CPXCG motif-containing cysteine-rich protein n=1 Tax=unclassified Agarivorans TaxID=2636026 RepID=UPI00128B1D4B|nr:CPXCG motif-containing cysteine-rich protein [Agarivorans sp. B2Z047]MPW30991.1 CPXCG motif-containing cysteine-rich protein [Agarivorans sp. B2Z047]UQN40782.1 CPXCG motif-containing cysteine-rich protein [Agarivorans sp. B2Z047]BEU03275.1 CPXCG motif-containing cysteine-rich protein [Agarivorans sp. OAG1]